MNQNGKALNAGRNYLRGVSILRADPFPALKPPVVILVLASFFLFCFGARSADFDLSGRSTFENFKPDGSKHKTFTGSFSVQKNGEKWVIVSSPDGVATTEHVMFDGIDNYTLTRNIAVDKSSLRQFPIPVTYSNGIAYAKVSTAAIFSGEYPLGASSTPRLLWLAFLSGPSIRKAESSMFPAPWGASFSQEARSFKLSVDWEKSSSEFPTKIRFIASNKLWTNSVQERGLTQTVTKASPFEDEFVAGVYQVMGWTNLGNANENIFFPLKFQVERYFPPSYKTKASIAERYSCELTVVRPIKSLVNLIELNEDVNVLDYRFRDKTMPWFYVGYPITNRTWKPTNDPIVRESIEPYKTSFMRAPSAPRNYVATSANPRSRTFVRVCLFLAMLSVPTIAVLLWIRKTRNKTELKHKRKDKNTL